MRDTAANRVASLLEGWRTLSEWEQRGHPGHRKWNNMVDKLNRIAEVAVTDPADVQELRSIAESHDDPAVRQRARQWVHPYVPAPGSDLDLQRWMNHPLVDLEAIDAAPQMGLAVVPVHDDVVLGALEYEPDTMSLTWLRGEPVAVRSEWPRRKDGIPLAHLAQIELTDHPPLTKAYPFMPQEGVLQFFHDLETVGDDTTDGTSGAWAVRYTPDLVERVLEKPDDLGDDAFRTRQAAEVEVTWTFPSSEDLNLSDEEFERLEAANQRVVETVTSRWGAREISGPADAVPMMFGYPAESRRQALELLGSVLPLQSDGDGYFLLIDIPGEGCFDGWVGDMGHLEFWIRVSDLQQGRFDRAWSLLR